MSTPNEVVTSRKAELTLSDGQTRRAMSLEVALALVAGRNVHIGVVLQIARWIYDGEITP